ncbi:MAG: cytochrome c [Rhizobiales bacterium]|nr:cytochrome c [Hyphomicrobiales bacterium]
MKTFQIAGAIILAGIVGWFAFAPDSNDNNVNAGLPIVQVAVPELDALAQEGEALFNANCARCHGTNAAGNDGAGPPLIHVIYEPSHHGDAAFYMAAKNGVRGHHWPFGNMAPIEGITDKDLAKIVGYVRTLQSANGIR